MDKHQLADRLRQRLSDRGLVSREVSSRFSDDEIIDDYITCSECGAKFIDPVILGDVIAASIDDDHFLRLTSGQSGDHLHS